MSSTILDGAEEDQVIHARLMNDERAIRRLTRRYHAYSSALRPSAFPLPNAPNIEELRESFLSDLTAYQVSLRKNALACQSEQRQVVAYQREKDRIAGEHESMRANIVNLKQQLAEAQIFRRRKIEYDQVAEKINTLPSRADLQKSILALEEEIAALQSDKDLQTSLMNARREKFDKLIDDINELRWMGKDKDAEDIDSPSPEEAQDGAGGMDAEDGEGGGDSDAEKVPRKTTSLNPDAPPFQPRPGVLAGPAIAYLRAAPNVPSPLAGSTLGLTLGDDIEMGEVEEDVAADASVQAPKAATEELEEGEEQAGAEETDKQKSIKPVKEELEEGEASDGSSSPLSELEDN